MILSAHRLLPALQRSTNLISAQFKLSRHLTGSPSRIIRMQMVNTLVVERFRTKFTLVVRSDNFFRFFLSQSTCIVSWPTFLAYSAFSLRSSASFSRRLSSRLLSNARGALARNSFFQLRRRSLTFFPFRSMVCHTTYDKETIFYDFL